MFALCAGLGWTVKDRGPAGAGVSEVCQHTHIHTENTYLKTVIFFYSNAVLVYSVLCEYFIKLWCEVSLFLCRNEIRWSPALRTQLLTHTPVVNTHTQVRVGLFSPSWPAPPVNNTVSVPSSEFRFVYYKGTKVVTHIYVPPLTTQM